VAFGVDLFFLSSKTKGALMLIGIFFYSSYVLGACLWQETGSQLEACQTFPSCMFTLMRLTFYDGNGFDYLWELSKIWPLLFFLTVLYLCATAFGVLNGLIGIFASTFTSGSIMELDDGTYLEDYLKRPSPEKKPFSKPPCGHLFQYTCGKLSCVLCPLDDTDAEIERNLEVARYQALQKGARYEEITTAASIKSVATDFEYDPSISQRYNDSTSIPDKNAQSGRYIYTSNETGFSGKTKAEIEDENYRKGLAVSRDEYDGKPRFARRENLYGPTASHRNPFVMQTPDAVKAALDRQSREIHELKETLQMLSDQIAELSKRSNSSIIPDAINPFR
jgi:hypothetical protein